MPLLKKGIARPRFLVICGGRPVSAGDDNYRLVEARIRSCQERGMRLGTVMLDRKFFDTRVVRVLKKAGATHLVPCADHGYARDAKKEFVAGRRERVSEAVITRDRNTSETYTIIMADKKKIDKKKDREPEDRIIAFCTNDPGIDVEIYAPRLGGETGNRRSSCRARAQGRSGRARACRTLSPA